MPDISAEPDARDVAHANYAALGVAHLITADQSDANRDVDPLAFTDDVRALYDRLAEPHRFLVAHVLKQDITDAERERNALTDRLAVINARCDSFRQRLAYLTGSRGGERDTAAEPIGYGARIINDADGPAVSFTDRDGNTYNYPLYIAGPDHA